MIIKTLTGNSSSKVSIMEINGVNFVRKYDNISRNIERYNSLSIVNIPFPKILNICENYYDIEYIRNIDVKTYLLHNNPSKLLDFIISVINELSVSNYEKDYTNVYLDKLSTLDFTGLIFSKEELLKKIPKILPRSLYFGDFSFDNILYNLETNNFVLIDGLTSDYDSYIFDLHKLKQDLVCKWFIRNEKIYISQHLKYITDSLSKQYEYFDDIYLTILMLLRVLPYCRTDFDKNFIITQVNKLWI